MPRCQQNGCRCARANVSNAVNGSSVASGSSGVNAATTSTDTDATFVEDMPMCHYVNPIPICTNGESGDGLEGEILAALQCQNQLLVDILGAINALTAATLCGRPCHTGPKDLSTED